MQKIKDEFVKRVEAVIPLRGLSVLEVGCGEGRRSVALAAACSSLVGIDPDATRVEEAIEQRIVNASFEVGSAEQLSFADHSFDAVFFLKSLHHVPASSMTKAIAEAVRVVRPSGHIIFLEMADTGTLYDATHYFAAEGWLECTGGAACAAVAAHPQLKIVNEWVDESVFKFDSVDDLVKFITPTQHLSELEAYLTENNFLLRDIRRTFVTQSVQ